MSHNQTTAAFREDHFEMLASAIDRINPAQRELFLAKLVILLVSNTPEKDSLPTWIASAQAHLDPA